MAGWWDRAFNQKPLIPWIETIPYTQSNGKLRQRYDRVKGPGDSVDNIMQMHSLPPHTMEAHMAMYKGTIHHSANTRRAGMEAQHISSCGQSAKQPFCDGSHKGSGFAPVKYTAESSKKVFFYGCKHTANAPLCNGAHKALQS